MSFGNVRGKYQNVPSEFLPRTRVCQIQIDEWKKGIKNIIMKKFLSGLTRTLTMFDIIYFVLF